MTVMITIDDPTQPHQAVSFLWLEITRNRQHPCTNPSPEDEHGSMTMQDWLQVIDEAAALGVHTVQFIGGEPTLHTGLPDLVLHALSHDLAVEVFTNLEHVTDELWKVFAQPGVTLATSNRCHEPEQHDTDTAITKYTRADANAEKALELGITLRTGIIDIGSGQHRGEGQDELVKLGVAAIGYDRLREIGREVRLYGHLAEQLCGRCGNGTAAVLSDGSVCPCVTARWMDIGHVRNGLAAALEGAARARAALTEQGMRPLPNTACTPHNSECDTARCAQ